MKFKPLFLSVFSLAVFLLFSSPAAAKSVPLTGVVYGDHIGLIHFDYQTARKPDPDPKAFMDPRYYIGPAKQFYISPYDSYFNQQKKFSRGNENLTVRISTDECTQGFCPLKGFAWSDRIGWIAFDGSIINQAISKSTGLSSQDENTAKDPYPLHYYPRISTQASANQRFAMTGYAWNQYTGWIRLSSDDSGLKGVTTNTKDQKLGDWGVWLNGQSSIERITTQPGPPPVTEKLGRRLHGLAWSEKLGWIKFSRESDDTFNFDFTAYTLWIPDKTPPIVLGADHAWFAVGVNNGFPEKTSQPVNVFFENFAIDPESGINERESQFYIAADPAFKGCVEPAVFGSQKVSSIAQVAKPIPGSYPVTGGGDLLDLGIPGIGNLKKSPQPYCKYLLHAKILNQVNEPFYIGEHFIPKGNSISALAKQNAITLYVRAGDVAEKTSGVKLTSSSIAIADGKTPIQYQIEMNDIAGNPILNVDCKKESVCSGRQVKLKVNLSHDLTFDLSEKTPVSTVTPVLYRSFQPSASLYLTRDPDPAKNPEYDANKNEWNLSLKPHPLNHQRLLDIFSYSPTESYDIRTGKTIEKNFTVQGFNYEIKNDALPPSTRQLTQINPVKVTPYTTPNFYLPFTGVESCAEPSSKGCPNPDFTPFEKTSLYRINQGNLPTGYLTQKPLKVRFIPPITPGTAEVISGGSLQQLSIGTPVDIRFELQNISSGSIDSQNGGGLSIDHIFQYSSKNHHPLLSLMEVRHIKNISPDDPTDSDEGWSHPFEPFDLNTRYEMFMKGSTYYSLPPAAPLPVTGALSVFRQSFSYWFDFRLPYVNLNPAFISRYRLPVPPQTLDQNGVYYLSGKENIPQKQNPVDPQKINDPTNYAPSRIDRNDEVNLQMKGGSANQPATVKKNLRFTPEKLIRQPVKDIQLNLFSAIAYRFPDQLFFTRYTAKEPLLKALNIQDIGLEAKGTVSAESTAIDRQFTTVGISASQKLQEQIRKNTARLTAGISPQLCPIPSQPLSSLPLSGPCVLEDPFSKSKVAYFEGNASQTLILGNGFDLKGPAIPYTLVIKGGAHLLIKENLLRQSPLGIVLISNQGPNESNVYITPKPTNIQAILYAEGSLLSLNHQGQLYYGLAKGDVSDLSHQLYWQGSIASRNTIGGAQLKNVPQGISCGNENPLECAKRYDLDFLRRFTAEIDSKHKNTHIIGNGKFSGGGTCASGKCQAGPLPTVIHLDSGQINPNKSELAPVFVEKDPLSENNPPPGFNLESELKSTQEIR